MAKKISVGGKFDAPRIKSPVQKSSAYNPFSGLGGAQIRGAAGEAAAQNSTVTSVYNPFSGTTSKTQEGQDFEIRQHIRQKASEDALKTSQVLPLLDDLEQNYREAYGNMIGASGVGGGLQAAKEYGSGVMLRNNQALRTLDGKLKAYRPALVRAAGDSGNFSIVEQQAASEGLPKLAPNLFFFTL